MGDINTSDFKEIVRNIENNKILLPDFQREFVSRGCGHETVSSFV